MTAPINTAGAALADGVYFDLAGEIYHPDPALGGTDHIRLAASPAEWQWQRLYGSNEDSRALRWGRAYHTRVLEGAETFRARHPVPPRKEDYGDELLVGAEDLRAFLKERGIKAPRSKAEMIEAVRAADPDVPIWDEIMDRFRADAAGADPIDQGDADQIELAAAFIQRNRQLRACFEGGAPEVSIVWTNENGIRLKGRLDYLKISTTIDLKTFRPWGLQDIDKAIATAIATRGYATQAAHYIEARQKLSEFVANRQVFGDPPLGWKWLRAVADPPEPPAWHWVFVKAEGAPLAFARQMGPTLLERGRAEVERARIAFLDGVQTHGIDQPWIPDEGDVPPILDGDDMPSWWHYV